MVPCIAAAVHVHKMSMCLQNTHTQILPFPLFFGQGVCVFSLFSPFLSDFARKNSTKWWENAMV